MSSSRSGQLISPSVMEQAILWQVRLLSGENAEQSSRECRRWCEESDEHAAAWQRVQRAQHVFDEPTEEARTLLGKALRQTDQKDQVDLHRRKTLRLLGASALALPGLLAWREYNGSLGLPADYATATGERRRITLDDGSVLLLNTGTQIDVRRAPDAHQLVLRRGEILLESAGQGGLPMQLVSGGRHYAIDAGAALLLRQYRGSDQAQLIRGRGGVVSNGHYQGLPESSLMRVNSAFFVPETNSTLDPTGWLDGALVVRNMPLQQFVDELSRYRSGWLRCDPAVADLILSGVFHLADTNRILSTVSHVLPVRVAARTPYWVSLLPA